MVVFGFLGVVALVMGLVGSWFYNLLPLNFSFLKRRNIFSGELDFYYLNFTNDMRQNKN